MKGFTILQLLRADMSCPLNKVVVLVTFGSHMITERFIFPIFRPNMTTRHIQSNTNGWVQDLEKAIHNNGTKWIIMILAPLSKSKLNH